MTEWNSYGKIEKQCTTCIYCLKRPDMKNVLYCIKRNFPILNPSLGCEKFERRNKNETR